MSLVKYLALFSTLFSALAVGLSQNENNSVKQAPSGPYLGQTPPGLTPEVFAPGIVATPYRDNSAFFSPDMKSFYLTRTGGTRQGWDLVVFKWEQEGWRESVLMPRVGRPILSPDGRIMHLGNKYMKLTSEGWSDIKSLGSEFEKIRVMRLSSSALGTYVLDEAGVPNGDGVIRYSRLINGKREAPRPFGKEINTGLFTAHPFIAPDESYLIWDTEKPDGFGSQDLYISFKGEDGSWTEGINMGDKINTANSEGGGYVSPDGKYFFFNRNINPDNYDTIDIFWVSTKLFEQLKP